MDAQTLCLDGTTIRAVNGKKQATSAELSRKKLEYARAQLEAVEKYLDSMDEEDLREARIDHPFALDLEKGRPARRGDAAGAYRVSRAVSEAAGGERQEFPDLH